MFYCVNVLTFIYPLYCYGHLAGFWFGTVINGIAVGFIVHIYVTRVKACLLGTYLRVAFLSCKQSCGWLTTKWRRHVHIALMSWWEPAWHTADYRQCTCPALIDTNTQFSKLVLPSAEFWGACKSQKFKKKKSRKEFPEMCSVTVRIGCYWFGRVHEFEILPLVCLAYSCLKFPGTNGM